MRFIDLTVDSGNAPDRCVHIRPSMITSVEELLEGTDTPTRIFLVNMRSFDVKESVEEVFKAISLHKETP